MMDHNLRILQVNLNRSPMATEHTLQLAVELAIDLIVIQEPWLVNPQTNDNYLGTRSVIHSSFTQILPTLQDLSLRPRVLLYASRILQAQINPIQDIPPDPDLLVVGIKSRHFNFTLFNIYHEKDQKGLQAKTIERALLPLSI